MYKPFEARSSDGLVTVERTSTFFSGTPQLAIPKGNGDYIFITKQQAMEFFGLIEAPAKPVPPVPKCACCGTTENLRRDLGSNGPYRCTSIDCIVY